MIDKKHQEFINFVIKDFVAEITTEAAVTFEFIDRTERESITSSFYKYAKSEEIEELMPDAYPTNTGEKLINLQASEPSESTYNLVDI